MDTQPRSGLTLPGSIVIAGAIIAIAIIWGLKSNQPQKVVADHTNDVTVNLTAINGSDHILGNPNAPIKIVEYSDPSCPFCKIFNPTMEDVMTQYGPSGAVAWIYRYYPLDRPDANGNILHPNAAHESQALECAYVVGGNDKFWAYEKKIYEVTPSVTPQTPKGLDQTQLSVIAKDVGLDVSAFNSCLDGQQTADVVQKGQLSGSNAGVSGTPTSFFILSKPANPTVDTFISNAITKYRLDNSMLFLTTDRKIIGMSGAMPKDLVTGLISALQ